MAQFQKTGGKEKLLIIDIKINKLSAYKDIICCPVDDKKTFFTREKGK